MALTAPANFKQFQDRKYMSEDETQSVEQFKCDKEMHRLIRKFGGPEVYSIYSHLLDSANPKHDWGCWPSYESIMEDLCILNRAIIADALQWLFDNGLIEWGLEGRKAWFIPLQKGDSSVIELLRHNPSFRNRTKDSSDRELKIVLIENANVYQSNVNQDNDKEELISNEINGEISPFPEIIPNLVKVKPVKTQAPLLGSKQGTLLNRLKTAYLAAGDSPGARNKRCGIIGEAWKEVTGKPPNYSFISKVMKDDAHEVGWSVIKAILSMADKDITEDPEGYLRRILQNGQQQRGPNMAGNGSTSTRTLQPVPKPFKPRGNRADGGFTLEEYAEDYSGT